MPTIQILTKNNEKTIQRCLQSVAIPNWEIRVGDLGSSDQTVELCRRFKVEVLKVSNMKRDQARAELSTEGINVMLQPWEVFAQGHRILDQPVSDSYVKILNGQSLSKEIRIWNGKDPFENPVFEQPTRTTNNELGIIFSSIGERNYEEDLQNVRKWKESQPILATPYYYESLCMLALGKQDDFLRVAEHYLFLDRTGTIAPTMTRYYCALVYLFKEKVRPTLQCLNLCLSANPLMAEFWCLTGDVYYHLLNRFEMALEFYENAQIMGARRLKTDQWPMDIPKYRSYPEKMIRSCRAIIAKSAQYTPST